jgi:pyruvate dehydrogenase E2 component (dihydrolipoamide acetyltransferase)
MAVSMEARVPDIGGHNDVPVIEVLVKPGDTVAKDQGLVTLESDKATMEVPAPFAGTVREVKVKLGDTLSEGSVVALIEPAGEAAEPPRAEPETPAKGQATKEQPAAETGTKVAPVEVPAQPDRLAAASIAAA